MAKKSENLTDKLNSLQRKYALSLQIKQDIDKLLRTARNEGIKSCQESIKKSNEKVMFEFADWYCNGLSNAERGTPEKMFEKFLKLRK